MRTKKVENYNEWYALIHEVILKLLKIWPGLRRRAVVQRVLNETRPDWASWKTERAMLALSDEARAIVKEWQASEKPLSEFIQHKPDGSKAQEQLGGAIELKATWRRD